MSDSQEVEPYMPGGGNYSEITPGGGVGGSKRRKRGKRNSSKRSQKRSKKYMKKMYKGGDVQQSEDIHGDVDDAVPSEGGRRRNKNKNKNKKTRKGKVSKWIIHVKNFSRTNKMDFRDALKDPKCKSSYHKMK